MNDTLAPQHPQLPRRLAALVYDTFLVLPIIMASVALAMGIRAQMGVAAENDIHQAALHPQLVQLIALLSVTVFFSWFWLRGGQTLGMQAWRIKLVSLDGKNISVQQALRRCLGATFSALCLGAGYWWCLFDKRKRYWHDYLSATELILLPAKEKKKKKTKKEKKR